jgi:hypothetical protein
MAVYRGQNVRIDYFGLELTEELEEAMEALDDDCAGGCGGTWEIFEEDPENGVPFRAIFVDMATDELVWNSVASSWTDGYDEDEDEDEDEEEDDDDAVYTLVG